MICLGIESTAHTLGVGVVKEKRVLANQVALYKPVGEGIHPRKAAEHHAEKFRETLESALKRAGVSAGDIGLIAYAKGPGLGAPLRVASVAARALSLSLGAPVVGVNHCIAHIEIGKLFTRFRDPLVLYVSGGNTQVIVKEGRGYRVIGETLDIGVGNLFDSFARSLKLEWAHGSAVEKMAEGGRYVPLPYVVKGMHLSFTGLLTEAVKTLAKQDKRDVCFSLQETAFSMLAEVTERALALTRKKEVLVCGGVAQNRRFRRMIGKMAGPHGARVGSPPNEFNADNGAMIAYTGLLMHQHGMHEGFGEIGARQRFRADEVELW
ncbi:MAG: KEOPS complex N(6)-L-threonylcarbamoyladenine synthase Kae1 [Candidatus Micrarchaeia archaeon]